PFRFCKHDARARIHQFGAFDLNVIPGDTHSERTGLVPTADGDRATLGRRGSKPGFRWREEQERSGWGPLVGSEAVEHVSVVIRSRTIARWRMHSRSNTRQGL